MADRIPLVVDGSNYRIEEVPSGDSIDLNAVSTKNTSVSGVVTVTALSSVDYPFKLDGVGVGVTADIYFTKYGQVGIGTSIGIFQGTLPGPGGASTPTRISPKVTIFSHEGSGTQTHPLRLADGQGRWDFNLNNGDLVIGDDTSVTNRVTIKKSTGEFVYLGLSTSVGTAGTSQFYINSYGQVGIGTTVGPFQGIKPGAATTDRGLDRISPKLTIFSHQTEGVGGAATQFNYSSHPLRLANNDARWDFNIKYGNLIVGYDNAFFDICAISTTGGVKVGGATTIPASYHLEITSSAGYTPVTGVSTVSIGGSVFLTGNDAAGDSTLISSARRLAIKKAVRAGAGASGEYISIEKATEYIGTGNTFLQGTGEIMVKCIVDSAVELYYDNTRRFSTSGAGCTTFGDHSITGALSKGSGSFRIDHPLAEDRDLVHSFIEGPQADLIYRGTTTLVGGTATVNLDEKYGLIGGTWEALCRDPQVWVTSDDGWTLCKGSVSGATLTITAQDPTCAETVSWLVVAERQDDNIKGADWTDENGRPILEPLKA